MSASVQSHQILTAIALLLVTGAYCHGACALGGVVAAPCESAALLRSFAGAEVTSTACAAALAGVAWSRVPLVQHGTLSLSPAFCLSQRVTSASIAFSAPPLPFLHISPPLYPRLSDGAAGAAADGSKTVSRVSRVSAETAAPSAEHVKHFSGRVTILALLFSYRPHPHHHP